MSRKARAVTDEGLTYLSASKFRRITAALRDVQCVPGDFVEFGVALGGSAIVIAHQANGRRFHGFDVFAMIPEPSSEKDDEKSRRRYQAINRGRHKGSRAQHIMDIGHTCFKSSEKSSVGKECVNKV